MKFLISVLALGSLEIYLVSALHELFDREWNHRMQEFPLFATATGMNDYNDKLTSVSVADQERRAEAWRGFLNDLTEIDRPEMESKVYAELIPNYLENKEEELKNRSAIYWVEKFPKNVPILLLHGNSDWRVKSINSLKLALEFEKHRIPYRLKIFEGADHGISEFRDEVNEEVIDWFNRYLKNNESTPNMEFHGK